MTHDGEIVVGTKKEWDEYTRTGKLPAGTDSGASRREIRIDE